MLAKAKKGNYTFYIWADNFGLYTMQVVENYDTDIAEFKDLSLGELLSKIFDYE